MTPPVCGIIGSSGSGKTEPVQLLVPRLAGHGLRVGYLKHPAHGFSVDR